MANLLKKIVAGSDPISGEVPIARLKLRELVNDQRTRDLLRRESYYRCSQHAHKQFDFYGRWIGMPGSHRMTADGYVPMCERRPAVTMDLAKVIVDRLTALIYGGDHYPAVKVDGDREAEDYATALCIAAKLPVVLAEARNIGGACGSVALSWGFVKGKPVVEVHQPAFIEVLEWADWPARKPAKVLKVYPYQRRVWDMRSGEARFVRHYFARYWDDKIDVTWEAIPEDLAGSVSWTQTAYRLVRHESGFCPVYWIQNLPNSSDVDGVSDYENQEDDFDEIDTLISATSSGAILNMDPTLVIHDRPGNNNGVVQKGSGTAIFSEKGAKYLELQGTAIQAARELAKDLRQFQLDKASVVIQDPDKASGGQQSAAAMKQRYLAMLAKCDMLREQYGAAHVAIVSDMLRVSRQLRVVRTDADGVQFWRRVDLPLRVEEGDDGVVRLVERTPGTGENVALDWPPYFPPTWEDRQKAVQTAKEASGGQQVLSQRTATASLQRMFSFGSVDEELERIEEDREGQDERAKGLLDSGGPMPPLQGYDAEDDMNGPDGVVDEDDTQ